MPYMYMQGAMVEAPTRLPPCTFISCRIAMAHANGPLSQYIPTKAVPYVKYGLQLVARVAGFALGIFASSKLLLETALSDVRKLGSHYDINGLLYGTQGPDAAQRGRGTAIDNFTKGARKLDRRQKAL